MYEKITKEYIETHTFKTDGVFFEKEKEYADYRFAPGTVLPKSPKEKEIELRKKISDIVFGKWDGNYAQIEAKTGIYQDTITKFLRNKKGRGFTRANLAKFCVGLSTSIEEAEELFRLQGFTLDVENNLLDAIVVNCIMEREDIYTFFDMCNEHDVKLDRKVSYI